jgi:hypothetical protein
VPAEEIIAPIDDIWEETHDMAVKRRKIHKKQIVDTMI